MNNLTKIIVPLIILSVSCSSDSVEVNEQSNNLLDCKVNYLFFNDDIRFTDNNFSFFQLDSIVFDYENQNISKVIGGFMFFDPFSSFNNKMLADTVYDSIIKEDNTYRTYTLPPVPYYVTDNPDNPVEYIITNNEVQKITRRDGLVLNYFYEDNLIIEKNNDDLVLRKFYLENNNLTKVEKYVYDLNLEVYRKTEILFEEYDTNPNPLKGKHYLLGAFYRSFSENNYKRFTINMYDSLEDGGFELYSTFQSSVTFEYNEDNYPLFGNYE